MEVVLRIDFDNVKCECHAMLSANKAKDSSRPSLDVFCDRFEENQENVKTHAWVENFL